MVFMNNNKYRKEALSKELVTSTRDRVLTNDKSPLQDWLYSAEVSVGIPDPPRMVESHTCNSAVHKVFPCGGVPQLLNAPTSY